MGKIATSWGLVKQSFQLLRTNKELMLLPVLSAISCLAVTAVIALGMGLALLPTIRASMPAQASWHPSPPLALAGMFVFYVANYFVIVFFNAALVGAVSIDLRGGRATLSDGLHLAWKRKGVILEWAALAATVGMILKLMEQRVRLVGQIVLRLIGVAWNLASFFVVPVLAFENLGPLDALKRSAELFRKNWGERVAAGFSFGIIFFLLALPALALPFAGGFLAATTGFAGGAALMLLYFILLAVISATTQGIFMTALYHYASTGQVSSGFKAENFSMAWARK